jgi:hypothetical protein
MNFSDDLLGFYYNVERKQYLAQSKGNYLTCSNLTSRHLSRLVGLHTSHNSKQWRTTANQGRVFMCLAT